MVEDEDKYPSAEDKAELARSLKNNVKYNRFVDSKKLILSPSTQMVRGKFYRIMRYTDTDGQKRMYGEATAPIIFTLYVSRKKDILHAVKISHLPEQITKKVMGRLVNKKEKLIEMKDDSRVVYKEKIKTSPAVKKDAYRTYKLSGITRVFELDMDETKLTPTTKQAIGINKNSHTRK